MRATLFRLAENEHVLLLLLHHIAGDGWSMGPLAHDLTTAYTARLQNQAPTWQPLPIQYADYTLWQHDALGTTSDPDSPASQQLAYWARALADLPEQIELPADRPRPAIAGYTGDSLTFSLPPAVHQELTALAQQNGVSLFMVLQAALATLLTRLGAGTDIPIGTPIAGRTDEATDNLVGFFVNTLVLRTDTSGHPTFRELLHRVRETDLDAYAHQDLPFERLVEHLNPTRTLAHHPLFQVMLTLNNTEQARQGALGSLPGLQSTVERADLGITKFDLLFTFSENRDAAACAAQGPGALSLTLEFSTDLFDRDTARSIADRLLLVLNTVAASPDQPIDAIEILGEAQRGQLLSDGCGPARDIADDSLIAMFSEQATRTPDSPAILADGTTVSYAELDTRSNRLAHHLIAQGAGPETVVAVVLNRGVDLMVALLGVLKAGAAYLPIDPTFPAERIAHMLDDAAPTVVLGATDTAGAVPVSAGVTLIDAPETITALADASAQAPVMEKGPWSLTHPAYVIYTSGSTGRPKGVVVSHRSLVNHMLWMRAEFGVGAGDRVLARTSPSFDAAVWEAWLPLVSGATVCVAPDEAVRDPLLLAAFMREQAVTVAQFVPTLLAAVLEVPEASEVTSVRQVFAGGEPLRSSLASSAMAAWSVQPVNLYGPTETTIQVTHGTGAECDGGTVPIGRPVWNTQLYVLDANLQPVPQGVTGELYVSGEALARGYLNRAGLTAERFVADPFFPGARMYRTGDLARWRRDRRLEYAGRTDHQVKLHGYRIELGEVENALTAHAGIAHAAVVIREDVIGNSRLTAYIVAEQTISTRELRTHLAVHLPDYMIPSAFVTLDSLPLTPNGKLDRNSLPAPDHSKTVVSRAPQGSRETQLAQLFAQILQVDAVDADDRFFDIGGDSILSIRLIAQARALGYSLTVRDVFEHQTVAALAEAAAAASTGDDADEETHAVTPLGPVPPTPMSAWLADIGGPANEFSQSLTVRTPSGLASETLTEALQVLLDHHDSLRLRTGPDGEMEVQPLGVVAAADCLVTVDAVGLDDSALQRLVVGEGTAARKRLSPDHGVMLQAVWLDRRAREGRLILLAHHLAVDTVSWHILLGDLVAACESAVRPPAPVTLQPTGTSWRQWAAALHKAAVDPARVAELEHWRTTFAGVSPQLRLDPARDTHATTADHVSELDTDTTRALLTWVPGRYNATLNELLLTAFTLAVGNWRRGRPYPDGPDTPVVVDLESHGRHEHAVPGADLTRTTGWFTAVYPLRLQHHVAGWAGIWNSGTALGQALKDIKEQLRQTPGDGLGFGLLRYLNDQTRSQLAELPAAEFRFNYHGRLVANRESGHWQPVSSGITGISPAMPTSHAIDLNSVATDTPAGPQLQARWTYASRLLTQDDAQQLAEGWFKALRGLVEHANSADAGGIAPSDVSHTSITQAELDQLEAELDSEWEI
ncbi:amino acid adenylation domain-containing protein [Streptomyces sp. CS014]|uniref:amino acid adenylation domain-containing protein n=1 Tax=Streptomyces sp. CS014 TaxID=2162707 RepID=UPI0023B8411F|nr:amino acid adenylation domain-containing protein [Streptomyces sp. CS014]